MFRLGAMLIVGSIAVYYIAGSAATQSLMSAQEIQARVIGNTITGVEDSKRYAEYLSPDGRILGRTASGAYSGNWRIEGDKLCIFYVGLGQGESSWGCAALMLTGNQLVWIDGDGDAVTTLSEGNSEYLEAERLSGDPPSADVTMRGRPADPAATRTEPANVTEGPPPRVAAGEGAPTESGAGRPAAQGAVLITGASIDAAEPAAGEPQSPAAATTAGERHDENAAAIPSATAPEPAMRNQSAAAIGPALAPRPPPSTAPMQGVGEAATSIESPVREADIRATDKVRAPLTASVITHARARRANAQSATKAAHPKLAAASRKPRRVWVVRQYRVTNGDFAPVNQHPPTTFGPE